MTLRSDPTASAVVSFGHEGGALFIDPYRGAVLGGLICGEIASLTSMFDPAWSQIMLFVAMTLVLMFRPAGLMGVKGRE